MAGNDRSDPREPEPPDIVLRLPDDQRAAFKDPFGPVYTDVDALLAAAGDPIVAVGDVVTHHLTRAGRAPDVAVVDGYSERERIAPAVRATLGDLTPDVPNPPATLTADLLATLREALAATDPVTIVVDGEEDLATLPAVLIASQGASVVYGQPGEGMVLVTVDEASRDRCRALFDRLAGDHERARSILGLPSVE